MGHASPEAALGELVTDAKPARAAPSTQTKTALEPLNVARGSTRPSRIRSDLHVQTERATGIEPAFSAWEADVLPLNYARETGRTVSKLALGVRPTLGTVEGCRWR